MAAALSEEQFRCTICLDSFKNPVSIPCGHNYCLECIKRYWDTKRKSDCPLCKETFKPRPDLRVNVGLKDITDQFKRFVGPVPPKRAPQRQSSRSDVVPCDLCDEHTVAAVMSCLVCQTSYCSFHLTPHQRDTVLLKHQLTDPADFATSHLCKNHNKQLEMFCKTDQIPVCLKCTERDHKYHETVPMEKESKRIKTQLKKTEAEFEQMIQARIRKTEEIKHALEMSQVSLVLQT
uniref:RING-type domain-containing protein n=1 Tax=Stegastes partitus TaxID=144197 RepID=A0A3B5A0C2_9TELE